MQSLTALIGPMSLVACTVLLMLAGACDVATRQVPNPIPVMLAALGAVLHVPSHDLILALGASFAVFVVGALCWRQGWMGGGDVKLLAAAAMLITPSRVPGLIMAVAMAGGLLAVLYLLLRAILGGAERQSLRATRSRRTGLPCRILRIEHWRIRRRAPLPYASAICAGAIFTLLSK